MEKSFIAWLEKYGVDSSAVKWPAEFPTGRGVAASRPISSGETILSVPESLIITSELALSRIEPFYTKYLPNNKDDDALIISLFVLLQISESKVESDDVSGEANLNNFYPYIKALPERSDFVNIACTWNDTNLELLGDVSLILTAQKRKEEIKSWFIAAQSAIENCLNDTLPISESTEAIASDSSDWKWDNGGANAAESTKLVASQAIARSIKSVLTFSSLEWCVMNVQSRAFLYGLGVDDLFISSNTADLLPVALVPLGDMFNHASSEVDADSAIQADWVFEKVGDEQVGFYKLIARKSYNEGDELLISYGDLNNRALLETYGFVPDDNVYASNSVFATHALRNAFLKFGSSITSELSTIFSFFSKTLPETSSLGSVCDLLSSEEKSVIVVAASRALHVKSANGFEQSCLLFLLSLYGGVSPSPQSDSFQSLKKSLIESLFPDISFGSAEDSDSAVASSAVPGFVSPFIAVSDAFESSEFAEITLEPHSSFMEAMPYLRALCLTEISKNHVEQAAKSAGGHAVAADVEEMNSFLSSIDEESRKYVRSSAVEVGKNGAAVPRFDSIDAYHSQLGAELERAALRVARLLLVLQNAVVFADLPASSKSIDGAGESDGENVNIVVSNTASKGKKSKRKNKGKKAPAPATATPAAEPKQGMFAGLKPQNVKPELLSAILENFNDNSALRALVVASKEAADATMAQLLEQKASIMIQLEEELSDLESDSESVPVEFHIFRPLSRAAEASNCFTRAQTALQYRKQLANTLLRNLDVSEQLETKLVELSTEPNRSLTTEVDPFSDFENAFAASSSSTTAVVSVDYDPFSAFDKAPSSVVEGQTLTDSSSNSAGVPSESVDPFSSFDNPIAGDAPENTAASPLASLENSEILDEVSQEAGATLVVAFDGSVEAVPDFDAVPDNVSYLTPHLDAEPAVEDFNTNVLVENLTSTESQDSVDVPEVENTQSDSVVVDSSDSNEVVETSLSNEVIECAGSPDIVDSSASADIVVSPASNEITELSTKDVVVDSSSSTVVIDSSVSNEVVDSSISTEVVLTKNDVDVDSSTVNEVFDSSTSDEVLDSSSSPDIVDSPATKEEAVNTAVSDNATVIATPDENSTSAQPTVSSQPEGVKTLAVPKYALEVQEPWCELLVSQKKTVETRDYPLPYPLLNTPIALISAPRGGLRSTLDTTGSVSALISGVIEFEKVTDYFTKAEFDADAFNHCVTEEMISTVYHEPQSVSTSEDAAPVAAAENDDSNVVSNDTEEKASENSSSPTQHQLLWPLGANGFPASSEDIPIKFGWRVSKLVKFDIPVPVVLTSECRYFRSLFRLPQTSEDDPTLAHVADALAKTEFVPVKNVFERPSAISRIKNFFGL